MSRESASGFGIGLLVGAAIGVAVGFLYAPRAGRETRAQLKESSSEILEKSRGKVADVRHTVGEKVADVRHTVGEKIAGGNTTE